MLFKVTYDPVLCGFSIAKKDKETIPPVYEQVYKTGGMFKMVTDAENVEDASIKFWTRYYYDKSLTELKEISEGE
jgi:hypothetical protein